MNIKIGCSGFPGQPRKYCEKFKMVEVDETFYLLPGRSVSPSLRDPYPPDLEFVVKAPLAITHTDTELTGGLELGSFKPVDAVFNLWGETEKAASALKAGVILFDSPESFRDTPRNRDNMRGFFSAVSSPEYIFAWGSPSSWDSEAVADMCAELSLVHCVDPFVETASPGKIGYFRLNGPKGKSERYRGWDLKKLKDICENETEDISGALYVVFNNERKFEDAERFEWMVRNTGRIKDADLSFLQGLCDEIEGQEEEEKVQILSQEADRIVMLILHTEYARVDIEIEKSKLRELCRQLFPNKAYLYEIIYAKRFDRLWEQFREPVSEQ